MSRRPATGRHAQLTSVAAAAWLLWAAPAAFAQASSSFTPSLSATTTYSSTQGRSGGNAGNLDNQFITTVSPGISWSSNRGAVQGNVSYALSATHYSKESEAETLTNTLAGSLRAELVEARAFVDASAAVGQSAVSPFGVQAVGDGFQAASNRVESRSATVSPYVRGSLGSLAAYELRHTASIASAPGAPLSGSTSQETSFSLSPASGGGTFGWGASASSQVVKFDRTASQRNDRVNVSLSYRPLPELQLGVSGGRETVANDGFERRSFDNWGWSANWQPTPRTNLNVNSNRRYFGNAHSVSFSHRMRRSTWTYTDSRGTTGGSNLNGVGQPVTLFALFDSLFIAQQPDPDLRRELVLEFIRGLNRDPGELVAGGFLPTANSLQRRQDLAFAINGIRSTFSLQAFRSRTAALGRGASSVPGNDSGIEVQLTGINASLSHRLTSRETLSLTGTQQNTKGAGTQPGNDLASLGLTYSSQVSRLATASLSARYAVFDSVVDAYREAAVSASLSLRF